MTRRPERIGVVGAGMVGLATAWHLQEHGAHVTVLDRDKVASGASWGNAGWVVPGLVAPLPEPAVLRYGAAAAMKPSSPVYIPIQANLGLLRFLVRFVRNSTAKRWRTGMEALAALSTGASEAFDALTAASGAADAVRVGPILACGRREDELAGLLLELEHIAALGQPVDHERLTGAEAREAVPTLTDAVGAAVRLIDQRFIDPGRFVNALAQSVQARGGAVLESRAVVDLQPEQDAVVAVTDPGERLRFDAVVVATGAWLPRLTRKFGVRTRVQAGRGYSLSVPSDFVPSGPIYLPAQRVACTPMGDRLRLAGMMEFRRPEAALDERRVMAIAESVRPFLSGVDLDKRTDVWVGSRPCTPDGLPVIGRTSAERVWVAGGHGMWGITLGAVSGRSLAGAMMTGDRHSELAPFDPLR